MGQGGSNRQIKGEEGKALNERVDDVNAATGSSFSNNHLEQQDFFQDADGLLKKLETIEPELMSPEEMAHHLLYQSPQPILDTMALELGAAGGYRPAIRSALSKAAQAAGGSTILSEGEEMDALVVAIKGILYDNRKVLGLEPDPETGKYFGASRGGGSRKMNYDDIESERTFYDDPRHPRNDRRKLGPSKKLEEPEEFDPVVRLNFSDALVRFVDRKKKGEVVAKKIEKSAHSKNRERGTVARMMEALKLTPKEVFHGEIMALVESREDLSAVTRAMNKVGKNGDFWRAAANVFLKWGLTVPSKAEEFIEVLTTAMGCNEGDFYEVMNRENPDPGSGLDDKEIQENKHWSVLQKEIAMKCIQKKDFEVFEIPFEVAEIFLEVYKNLEGTEWGKDMETQLHHAGKIPETIIVQTGASVLASVIHHYNKTGQLPKQQEWIEFLLAAQNEHPDLTLGEDHKYHYVKPGGDLFDNVIQQTRQVMEEKQD